MKLNIVIVLYNKAICQSKTVNSLLDNIDSFFNTEITVCIWNNGPSSIRDEVAAFIDSQTFKNFVVCENLSNSPLSFVYNSMLNEECANIYFDDDTFVTQEYVLSVNDFMKGDREVFLPSIVSLNQRRYPKVNKVAGDFNGELSELSVVSILSGLLIKEDTIRRLKCKFGDVFDHRFNIYGVDTTLFYRLKSINFDRYYVGGILEHDLSGVSAGGAQYISMFRVRERLWDFTLQTIFYRKLGALLGLIQFLKTYKSRLTISFVFEVFVKALFYMGHPNTKKKSTTHTLFPYNE